MIQISEHQPGWAEEFLSIRNSFTDRLGGLAKRVDHIGSTSVLGLCAKDILDIQVSVAALNVEVINEISACGFVKHPDVNADHVPPGYVGKAEDWSKYFFMQPVGQRRINLHVRKVGNPNQRYAILFRDYLKSHTHVALAYGELKKRLAVSLINDAAYPEVKDPAVDLIYFAAEQWALQTGWSLNVPNA
jgi:GrpB-like predicted nucleotidyltransferase (UPF0157 family)